MSEMKISYLDVFFSSGFVLWAVLMLALTLAFILPPLLWRSKKTVPNIDQNAVNVDVLRDDLAELTRDHRAGLLSDADFAQAKEELLQRCVLEESGAAQLASATLEPQPMATTTVILLAVIIPMTALLVYFQLGEPKALDAAAALPREEQQASHMEQQQFDQLVAGLAERLRTNPDDLTGWQMLARSYKVMGRFKESAEAFAKASELAKDDPGVLADYAESLFWAEGETWSDEAHRLLQQALTQDAKHARALLLSGAAARSRGDVDTAVDHWRRLLEQTAPDAEEAIALRQAIDEALAEEKAKPASEENPAGTR